MWFSLEVSAFFWKAAPWGLNTAHVFVVRRIPYSGKKDPVCWSSCFLQVDGRCILARMHHSVGESILLRSINKLVYWCCVRGDGYFRDFLCAYRPWLALVHNSASPCRARWWWYVLNLFFTYGQKHFCFWPWETKETYQYSKFYCLPVCCNL